ncbi:MAG: hypothetical protein COX79_03930 [Candidatus Levybacteria bacterium CG_4_10_14_0_2_um_filter_36_16]|nr:MAG: hypothetical protein COU26_04320 [Candidatus Levybacteria bacterium CG10_big_fil_rev_8_21_14_0_10_36_30]PIZ96994.1 MAG: hypothetical protein COX79_03930 [Candidatus Levybacteria bacterium CG_4_10_14_0_2_um_filter_36_16]
MPLLSFLLKNRIFRILFITVIIVGGIVVYQNWPDGTCKDCNIILISVDTLRPDHMGIYGYPKNTTPNIDKWAKNATVFTNTYTIIPETDASFYTLFTGSDNFIKGENMDQAVQAQIQTLAMILKGNHFDTAAFVTNPVTEVYPFFKKGFDQFSFFDVSGLNNGKTINKMSYKFDYQNAKELTKEASKWLSQKHNNKFFSWIHYTTPHTPYNPSLQYLCKIDKGCKSNKYQPLLTEESPASSYLKSCSNQTTSETIHLAENLYDAEIISVDEEVGKILKAIKDNKLDKKTIVIFYGDHGEGFDHDIFTHGISLYQSGIKIPLIIYNPLFPNFSQISKLSDNTDILPTILNFFSIKYGKTQFLGQNLLTNPYSSEKNYVKKYIYFKTPQEIKRYAILDGKYKYIISGSSSCAAQGQEELYNIKVDPNETNNLIDQDNIDRQKLKLELSKKIQEIKLYNAEHTQNQDIINKLKSLGY